MSDEAKVLQTVLTILKQREDTYVLRMDKAPIGTPDVIACVNGRFVAIEVKDDVNGAYTTTGAQKLRLKQILNAKGLAFTVDKNTVGQLNDTLDFYTHE